jgi:hypothetical protein
MPRTTLSRIDVSSIHGQDSDSATRWFDAKGISSAEAPFLLLAVLFPSALLLLFWFLGPISSGSGQLRLVLILPTVGITVAYLFILYCFTVPRSVGVAPAGVVLRFVARSVSVPWDHISPDLLVFSGSGLRVRYRPPSGGDSPRLIVLTPAQGRGLLTSPFAPRWPGPADVLRKWGLIPPCGSP